MKITVKRTADAPLEDLWIYLADFSNIARFHPMLNSSHYIEGPTTLEVGSVRQCDFQDGSVLKEKVSDCKEGSHYSIDIVESSMPVKDASATLGLRPINASKTETYMSIKMTPKNKLMQPMMYLMFKFKVIPGILKGLEDLYLREHQVKSSVQVV